MELLKYRGLSEEKVEFIYGFLEKNIKGEYFIQEEVTDHKFLITHRVIEETIGWSTGAKDINKKESYLGDILKEPRPTYGYEPSKDHEKAFYIVKKELHNNNMYLEYNFNIRGYWEKNNLQLCRIEDLEIVGNIYENQEMIKKK